MASSRFEMDPKNYAKNSTVAGLVYASGFAGIFSAVMFVVACGSFA